MKDGFQIMTVMLGVVMASMCFGFWMNSFTASMFMFFLLASYYFSKLEA